MQTALRRGKGYAALRIEDPDVLHAKRNVICNSRLKPAQPIFRRKNLNRDQRGASGSS